MNEAVILAIDFITTILGLIPDSPFMFLIALAIVLIILGEIYSWIFGGRRK